MKRLIIVCSLLFLSGCNINSPELQKPLKVVSEVDLERYMGKWFEIASIPVKEQKDCTGTTATYSLNKDKTVKVVNQCFQKSLDGPVLKVEGKAFLPDTNFPGKLKVQFFWPFSGDYWIIELDKEYNYAIVGSPSRDYLWVLSRAPKMEEATYKDLLKSVESQGYDLSRIVKAVQ